MVWARMLAYITGTVDQELLLRNEYLAAENRILKAQIKGRLRRGERKAQTYENACYQQLTLFPCPARLTNNQMFILRRSTPARPRRSEERRVGKECISRGWPGKE